MSKPADFVELLQKDPRGLAWIYAMAHGHTCLGCEPVQWKGMFKRAYGMFERNISKGHKPIANTAWQALDFAHRTHPGRKLVSTTPTAPDNSPSVYTHVTTSEKMEAYHFNGISEVLLGRFIWRAATDNADRLRMFTPLLQEMHRQGLFKVQPGATFGVDRLWVSSADLYLECPDDSKRSPASYQRDYRGLIHLSNLHFLVGYALDVRKLPTAIRPVALDGAGIRFRSWSYQRPDNDNWGSAVDLHNLAAGQPEIDGAPEGVTPSAPFELEALVEVVPLGHPGAGEPWVGERGLLKGFDDNETFSKRIETEGAHRDVSVETLLKHIEEDINGDD